MNVNIEHRSGILHGLNLVLELCAQKEKEYDAVGLSALRNLAHEIEEMRKSQYRDVEFLEKL